MEKNTIDQILTTLNKIDKKVDRLAGEVAALKLEQQRIVQGVAAMSETLATHTEMLTIILQAATEEQPPSDLAEAMRALAGAVEELSERLEEFGQQIDRNTATTQTVIGTIDTSIKRNVQNAFKVKNGECDADGVVLDDHDRS